MANEESIDDRFMIRKHVSHDQNSRGHDLKQEGLNCNPYDDISSDAVDAEEPLDVVGCEQENMVEENQERKSLSDGVKVESCKSNDGSRDICGNFSESKNSGGLDEVNVCLAGEGQDRRGEDLTKDVHDSIDRLQADHREETDLERKSLEKPIEHTILEPKFIPTKVKEYGGKQCKDGPVPTCDYRTGFKHSLYGRNSPMERCSPPNFSSDSDTDFSNLKSNNQKLIKSLLSSDSDLMKFAEILYKCTLCTSIPSILTSKSSFLKHVKEQHFKNDSCLKKCELCSLKFRTEEDLKEHVSCLHKETNQIPDNVSHDQTGSDVIMKSHDSVDNENDSDSDSSGHRNYKAKLVKKVKPVLDFENPKQLVDHTGIQTLDGSLDLSKKDSSSKVEHKEHTVSVKAEQKTSKTTQEPNMVHVQQITDQIMKSNFQGRNPSTPNGPLSFTPSFTPEFGKYTKLVREGGNIVYFCQVCNWKSPIKATFHGHCGTATHKSKVLQTEDPDSTDSSSVVSDRNPSSRSSPNISVSAASETKPRDSNYWTGQNRPYGPKTSEAGLFGQFVPPRGVSYNGRPQQVASPFKNGNSTERNNPYKRSSESSSESVHKGSKKFSLSSTSAKKAKSRGGSSDSDSDDGNNNNSKPNENLFPWNKHPLDMPSLYQNYPLLPFCSPSRFSYDRLFSSTLGSNKSSKPDTDSTGSPKNESQLFSFSSHKRQTETSAAEEDTSNKRSKGGTADNTETAPKDAREKEGTLFKLYKCHACSFEYSDIEEYEKHFDEVHKVASQAEAGARGFMEKQAGRMNTDVMAGDFETGENFRVQKLKEIIPDFVVEDGKGNISRDFLLQCISTRGIPNVELWSSACNKAMREVYPQSLAQRKGKYKKTYYFGVAMVEAYQGQEETPAPPEGDPQLYNPLRDLNLDMEKIMEQLPTILFWTGSTECGVYRGEVLMVIAENLQNQDIHNWGPQCNRAIRLIFPKVDIKRKGKFKSTMYFGVDFHSSVRKNHVLTMSKMPPMPSGFFDGAEHFPPQTESFPGASEGFPGASEGFPGGEEFPLWMKQEAQKNMKWYLQRFGGVTSFDTAENEAVVAEDDDNDGDDEEESMESSANP